MSKLHLLKDKAVGLVGHLTKYWRHPAPGSEVPFREYLNYGMGGMGVQFILYIATLFALNAGNTLLGTCLGIEPMHLQVMLSVCTICNFAFLFLRGFVFDNIRSSLGKFRPLILVAIVPIVVIAAIFLFMPIDKMVYSKKVVLVFVFAFIIQVLNPYMQDSIAGIGYVISTKSNERANVVSVYSIIFSLAPTITGLIIPIIMSFIPGGYTNILSYRYIMIPLSILGIGMACFAVFGTKERIIKPKNYVPKTNVLKSMGHVFKNKYWWIRNFAGWFAFLEGASANIFAWLFIYGNQNLVAQGLVNTIMGTSALIAMIITPFLIRKIGNKNILLLNNFTNIIFLMGMLVFRNSTIIFAFLLYLNNISNALAIIYNPVIDGEIRDYQQYVSNKRIDGVFIAASMINIPILIAAEFVVPFAYQCFGLTRNFDILYDPSVRNSMFSVLLIMAVIGAFANFLPFLFYNFPNEMHKSIVRTIRLRTVFADYVDDKLTPELIKACIDDYREVIEISSQKFIEKNILKQALADARALPKSTQQEKLDRKNAINKVLCQISKNNSIERNKKYTNIYLEEFNKHSDNAKVIEYKLCKNIVSIGLVEFSKMTEMQLESMIENIIANEDMVIDESCLEKIKKFTDKTKAMHKKITKNYPEGFIMPDLDAIDNAQLLPEETKEESKEKSAILKELLKERKTYDSTTAYYEDIVLTVKRYDGALVFEEIEAMYDDACIRLEKKEALERKAENDRKELIKNKLLSKKQKAKKNHCDSITTSILEEDTNINKIDVDDNNKEEK